MPELLFIFGFTVHNAEEAIWLPRWSQNADRFQKPVRAFSFRFAVLIITLIGYVLSLLNYTGGSEHIILYYSYLGFVAMMVLNIIFPHLIACLIMRRYAPGTLTAILLNGPFGIYILVRALNTDARTSYLLVSTGIMTILILLLIKVLLKLGDTLKPA